MNESMNQSTNKCDQHNKCSFSYLMLCLAHSNGISVVKSPATTTPKSLLNTSSSTRIFI